MARRNAPPKTTPKSQFLHQKEADFEYAPVTVSSPARSPVPTQSPRVPPKPALAVRVSRHLDQDLWPFRWISPWWLEILGLSIAAGTLAAIAILLIRADGYPPEVYPYGITLNGIIAILSTISKGAMLSVVGVCLGQLKWNRFTNPKRPLPLSQFAAIDRASHGALGSFTSILSAWRMPLVLAGIVITITSVGFDFAVQQIVGFEQRSILAFEGQGGTPVLPRAQTFLYDYDNQTRKSRTYLRCVCQLTYIYSG
jgi:hypothetical protein